MIAIGNIVLKNSTRELYHQITSKSLYKISVPTSISKDYEGPHADQMLDMINIFANVISRQCNYFLNYEEDHFCVLEDRKMLDDLLETCKKYNVDAIRASFHRIEMDCARHVPNILFEDETVKIFRMTPQNFEHFCKPYKRFYLGTNCIFSVEYGKKFFSNQGQRPHDCELRYYQSDMEYICAVPKFEILRPIDDDHGAKNTCMLNNPTPYFTELYNQFKNGKN